MTLAATPLTLAEVSTPVAMLLGLLGVIVAVIAVVYLAAPVFQGIAWLLTNSGRAVVAVFRHLFRFIFGMAGDFVRAIGGVITSIVLVPLIIVNVIIGRWSAAGHYGRAFQDEIVGIGHGLYRFFIGHPAKFFLLGGLVEGIEQRIPQAVAQSPGADRPSARTGEFEGYTIVGSLQGGGSGGRLYVAEPDERKRAAFARAGRDVKQVVIKAFSLADGSSLPQIIRESRALEAAKKMGLILDHELTDARFFYVMEYIPGDSLTIVTKRLHAEGGPQGLGTRQLFPALGMISDLLAELDRYHKGGLWHKDVKPDNIIINQGRAHLVDLGLVTPLRSAMTLTTHGTEYFRDPELVRMALRGAKVNEVDGVKFDIYGVGAVLYSVIENSFPAHGGLSQITRSCPEALRWVVRRAMADLHNRYATSLEMLADLRTITAAPDPFMLKPADLPSVSGGGYVAPAAYVDEFAGVVPAPPPVAAARSPEPKQGFVFEVNAGVGTPTPTPTPPHAPAERRRPRISITDWWTGRYAAGDEANPGFSGFDPSRLGKDAERVAREAAAAAAAGMEHAARVIRGNAGATPVPPRGPGRSAQEQLAAAHDRVRRAQQRVAGRLSRGAFATSFHRSSRFSTRPNKGVAGAFFVFLTVMVAIPMALVVVTLNKQNNPASNGAQTVDFDPARAIQISTNTGQVTIPINSDGALAIGELSAASHGTHSSTVTEKRGGARISTDISELNKVGERVSDFFDRLRDRSAATSATATEPTPAPAPQPPADPVTTPAAPPGSAGSILILNLLPADVRAQEDPRVAAIVERLTRRGFAVRGAMPTDDDTELLASGKRVVELAQPDDADAASRVRAWLNNPATGVDAVLWIGVGKEPGAVMRRLVVRDSYDEQAVAAALAGR
ncbi:MAG: hypothetical protein JNK58_06665 [Phycisphaerae bacterium]|nr:hypothetical protein [Phycisphaerae bacterium]